MNALTLLLMSVAMLAGAPESDQSDSSAAAKPLHDHADNDSSRDRIDRIRARHLRRRIRDLRLEVVFVEARIAAVPAEREQALARVRLAAATAAVDEQVQTFFEERASRLRERLSLITRQLSAAQKRLVGLTGDAPGSPADATPQVDNDQLSLKSSDELR